MASSPSAFKVYAEECHSIFGNAPTLELLIENHEYPFAHEAGVYVAQDNTHFVTSNQFVDPSVGRRHIRISKICLPVDLASKAVGCEEIDAPMVPMANGGVNDRDGILFCAQGTLSAPGGLVWMDAKPPYTCSSPITSFHGLNDVVVHSDGGIWFTDPIYGFEQGIRPKPRLPSQVCRFDPDTGPDEEIVYITDTDWIHGDGTTDDARVSHIYAFDVATYSGQPFLTSRRLFTMADKGVPDGINGCGDSVSIWSPGGVLLGKILVDGGVANFCFGVNGELFLLNENRIWRAQLSSGIKGDLLRI
ncbi:uncharacterized protein B0I36DRAFT_422058 [Microdochium trichocladiopsis]|uniref:SMP-30/Gluconolactonase/LRE-like region domain-containing protein n=1 Tax=Microdochium trichocladiopsis TaxID=1682393 RepID=A0A9P9BS78_9PEZI|nr:uncharacterized protein B0I36DRAFT_422058 [Microdochium trichocladiopsis]KAH7033731.1 hypothetical protein B0I36DRAFT_422058 [Microdochium trichocladiopsis]